MKVRNIETVLKRVFASTWETSCILHPLLPDKDVLQSSPNNTLFFKEDFLRSKRDPKPAPRRAAAPPRSAPAAKHARRVARDSSLAEDVERAMQDLTTTAVEGLGRLYPGTSQDDSIVPPGAPSSRPFDDEDYGDLEVGGPHKEPPGGAEEDSNVGSFPEISEDEDASAAKPKQIDVDIEGGLSADEPYGLPPEEDLSPEGLKSTPEAVKSDDRPLVDGNSQDASADSGQYGQEPVVYEGGREQPPSDLTFPERGPSAMPMDRGASAVAAQPPYEKQPQPTGGAKKEDFSEIVLSIDKVGRPRLVTEDKISRLISSCSSDFDCAETAACVRTSLKQRGFCRCLPGSSGVGIFCREETWMSHGGGLSAEELADPGYVAI